MSSVIEDALASYLRDKAPDPKKREKAYKIFCEQPMHFTKEQSKKIMEADSYE